MAKHGIRANKRKQLPETTIQAAPSFYERTHPVGSAERFLDAAAKEALVAAAAGGVPTPKRLIPGAVRAVTEKAEEYPDPLLAEAARLPREELLRRAARADAFGRAMETQNDVVAAVSAATSPVGNMVENQVAAGAHDALTRQDAKGGDAAGSETAVSGTPVLSGPGQNRGGTRIVINPQVFKDKRDALCVAMNEGFRILMEANGFDPVSEPTEDQRRFFADTGYAHDENMLRRTILARILTFDTSVTNPTESQLQEALEFLNTVLEIGAPQNQWEQWAVRRIVAILQKTVGLKAEEPAEPEGGPTNADIGGGTSAEDEELKRLQEGASGVSVQDDTSTIEEREQFLAERGMDTSLAETGSMQQLQQMHEEQEGGGPPEPPTEQPAAADKPTGSEKPGSPTGQTTSATADRREAIVAANGAELDARAKEHVAAANRTIESLDQHIASAEALSKTADDLNKSTDQILAQGEKILAETGKGEQAEANGDMGSRSLTNTKSMNGPAIKPTRPIGDMGSRSLTNTKSMNGPAIKPARAIGDMGARTLTNTKSMNGPDLNPPEDSLKEKRKKKFRV